MFRIFQRSLIPILAVMVIFTVIPAPSQAANVKSLLKGQALKWQGQIIDLGPLQKFYKSRRGKGIWTDKKGLTKQGKALLSLISRAGEDGLVAADYIKGFPARIAGNELGGAELYMSQAFWKFGRDLSAGRTTPAVSEPDIVISRKKTDIKNWLTLAGRKGPAFVINALRPPHAQYLALRRVLGKSKGKKAKKIIINMERWRWLPRNLGKRHVMVNQAAFELTINDNGKVVDRRRVVIGQTFHKTPMFSHAIKFAEFNPTWTVSRSIAGNELLPKLRKDPGYLEKRNYKIYTSWKKDAPAMNAHSIDWHSVSNKNFPYRIVQQPGENNALGQVKFIFPNKFKVYLHDTQSKALFKKNARAFSHGCIRVENPLDFADKLYASERSLNAAKISKIVASGKTKRVKMKKPVPVHLAYFTVWVEGGKVKTFKDVYGRDKLVGAILFGGV
jgi:murein L,D-transpeptidase YcbB/YkuD